MHTIHSWILDARARVCVRLPGMQMLARRARGLGLLRAYVRLPGNANMLKVCSPLRV